MCELAAPGLFQLDADGHLHLLTGGTVTASETVEAQAAVSGCPADALRFG